MKKKIMRRVLTLLAALVMCVLAAGVASATGYYGDTKFPTFDDYAGCDFIDFDDFSDLGYVTWYYSGDYADELEDYMAHLINDLGFDWILSEIDYDEEGVKCNVFVDTKTKRSLKILEFSDDSVSTSYIVICVDYENYKNQSFDVSTDVVNAKISAGVQTIEVSVPNVDDQTGIFTYSDNGEIAVVEWVYDDDWNTWIDGKAKLKITPIKSGVCHVVICVPSTLETQIVTINVSSNTTQKVSKKLPSATKYKANPNLGSGTWKTSNSSIVSLSKKKGSTCTFTLKKAGKAKVTFKSSLGTYVYNITVYNKKSDPLRAGFIEMDSADGIEPTIFIANTSSKTIKYVDFKVTFYNAVGDKVQNEIGYGYTQNLQIIGPIKPWTMDYFKWDPVFYNGVAKRMYVKSATVTYMNGSKKTFSIKKSFSFSTTEADKYYKYC